MFDRVRGIPGVGRLGIVHAEHTPVAGRLFGLGEVWQCGAVGAPAGGRLVVDGRRLSCPVSCRNVGVGSGQPGRTVVR